MASAECTIGSAAEVESIRPQSAITVMSVAPAAMRSTLTLAELLGANAANAASA
jgi:hypothetical protein